MDLIDEQVDQQMTEAEEAAALKKFAWTPATPPPGDLADGGNVNGARLFPAQGGVEQRFGRPSARRAWSWNGTESVLPLAWNPDGNRHDGARHYLRKRVCLCCKAAGFVGRECRACAKSNCVFCAAGTDRTAKFATPSGAMLPAVIPCFYLTKEQVPFPERFYGDIDCFLASCPRRGERGFKIEMDMRMHAQTRHRMEYAAFLQGQQVERADRVAELERRIDGLMRERSASNGHSAPPPQGSTAERTSSRSPAQIAATERMRSAQKAKQTASAAT